MKRTMHQSHRLRAGVSLLEVLVAMVVLSVGMLGASGFRYYTAIQSKRAQASFNAIRAAQALLDTWCGLYGDEGYLPENHLSPLLTVSPSVSGPVAPTGYTILGTYEVLVDDVTYYATLSYNDFESGYRTLNIVIAWRDDYQAGSLEADDESITIATCVMLAPS
jgi:prepilin-type N-terminal cleavage/methylation domain-containing protein